MIVTRLNILYITININYFYIMGVYGCRLNKKGSGDRSILYVCF